jgi:hypothetical protein
LVEYEARASAALQQAVTEEERLEAVSRAASMKQEMLDAAFKSVKVCVGGRAYRYLPSQHGVCEGSISARNFWFWLKEGRDCLSHNADAALRASVFEIIR